MSFMCEYMKQISWYRLADEWQALSFYKQITEVIVQAQGSTEHVSPTGFLQSSLSPNTVSSCAKEARGKDIYPLKQFWQDITHCSF